VNIRHAAVSVIVAVSASFLFFLASPAFASIPNPTAANVNAYWGPIKGSTNPGADIIVWNGSSYQRCKTACGSFSATNSHLSLKLKKYETLVSGNAYYQVSDGSTVTVPWRGQNLALTMIVNAYGTTATLNSVVAKLLLIGHPVP
jgi:hypothetical protein